MTIPETSREQIIEKIYQTGMQLAQHLRMLDLNEEAHLLEMWILDIKATGGKDEHSNCEE
jgi:hypothetical protein